MADATYLQDGNLISVSEVGDVARMAREVAGLTPAEAAALLDITSQELHQAEYHRARRMLKLRKQILERFAGLKLEGPYYRLRRL